jgi:hypothetical protein
MCPLFWIRIQSQVAQLSPSWANSHRCVFHLAAKSNTKTTSISKYSLMIRERIVNSKQPRAVCTMEMVVGSLTQWSTLISRTPLRMLQTTCGSSSRRANSLFTSRIRCSSRSSKPRGRREAAIWLGLALAKIAVKLCCRTQLLFCRSWILSIQLVSPTQELNHTGEAVLEHLQSSSSNKQLLVITSITEERIVSLQIVKAVGILRVSSDLIFFLKSFN